MGSRYRVHPDESGDTPSAAAPGAAPGADEATKVVGGDLGALFVEEPPAAAPAPRTPKGGCGEGRAKVHPANSEASGAAAAPAPATAQLDDAAPRKAELKQTLTRTTSFAKRREGKMEIAGGGSKTGLVSN